MDLYLVAFQQRFWCTKSKSNISYQLNYLQKYIEWLYKTNSYHMLERQKLLNQTFILYILFFGPVSVIFQYIGLWPITPSQSRVNESDRLAQTRDIQELPIARILVSPEITEKTVTGFSTSLSGRQLDY